MDASMRRAIRLTCPCLLPFLVGDESAPRKLVESNGGNSESDRPADAGGGPAWLQNAIAPIKDLQRKREEERARKLRAAVLQEGTVMRLITGKSSISVRLQLSQDGTMLTWQTLETQAGQASESGVIALAIIREIKPILQGGLLSHGTPAPLKWQVVSDEETLRLEAQSEMEKENWMCTLQDLAKHQAEAKVARKMGYLSKRRMGLEERRKEAERRKAEVLKTCAAGGMRHTATAMMNRS